eukprot:tig00001249_g7784.t1
MRPQLRWRAAQQRQQPQRLPQRLQISADSDILIEEVGRDTLVFNISRTENVYLVKAAMWALVGLPSRKHCHAFLEKLRDFQARAEESMAGEARVQYLIITDLDDDKITSLDHITGSLPPLCLVATPEAQQKIITSIPRLNSSDAVWTVIRSEADILSFGDSHVLQTVPGRGLWADSLVLCDTHSLLWFTGRLFAHAERGPSATAARSDLELAKAARRAWYETLPPLSDDEIMTLEGTLDEPGAICPSAGPVAADPNVVLRDYIRWVDDA